MVAVAVIGVGAAGFIGALDGGGSFASLGALTNSLTPDATPALGSWDPSQGPSTFQGSLSFGINVPTATDFACPHGSVQSAPTVNITVPALHLVNLRASTSNHPVVIVRNTDTGAYSCDHEASGPAQVNVALPPGTHAVWVGDVFTDPAQVALDVSAEPIEVMPLPSGLAAGATPTVATIDLDAQQDDVSSQAGIAGVVEGRGADPSCRGWFPVRPHLSLSTSAERSVVFTTTGSSDDLTMLLRHADGTLSCDDDSGGRQMPRISARLSPGTHELWVGVFREGQASACSIQMSAPIAAEVLPSGIAPSAPPIAGELNIDRRVSPVESATQPQVDASDVSNECRGYIPVRPHVVLRTTRDRAVTLTTRAGSDLTMLVRTVAGAIYCDDDSGSRNQPRVRVRLGPGEHHVWVGAYRQDDADVPFTLRVGRD